MTTTAVAPQITFPDITLAIHICDQRRSYRVTFTGPTAEDQALAFLKDRSEGGSRYGRPGYQFGNHVWDEIDGQRIPEQYGRLLDFMYPVCEHGMSLDLCMGPGHFMDAAQERELYGF